MYDGKTQLLIRQPINRFIDQLAGWLPKLEKRTSTAHFTIQHQKDSPGKAGEANWLASPQWPDLFGHAASTAPKESALKDPGQPPALQAGFE